MQAADEPKVPKYIFLFIGDGMSYPQVQTTNYYLNAIEDDGDDILTSEKATEYDEISGSRLCADL